MTATLAIATISLPNSTSAQETIRVALGRPEVVLGPDQTCAKLDVPDMFPHVVRIRASGTILLSSTNAPVNYLMSGATLDDMTRDCGRPSLVSRNDSVPGTFANQQWIAAPYVVHDTVLALVHNEYHDPFARNCRPGRTDPSNPCWYNSITEMISTDGGGRFHFIPYTDLVVAAPPVRWSADSGAAPGRAPTPFGYFTPSNIVTGPGGYLYSMFMAIESPVDQRLRGVCIMRTRTPLVPQSWRAWDGKDFTLRMASPYRVRTRWCEPVSRGVIRDLHGSLTYNTYLKRFILVGSWADVRKPDAPVCGTFFATSSDLITWTQPQLMMRGKPAFPPCSRAGDRSNVETYPSLIDPSDTSTNFERTGKMPYLYYVHIRGELDRVLMRVPVRFERVGEPTASARP